MMITMNWWQSQINITIFGEDCWRPRCDRIRASVSAPFTASAWSACWHYYCKKQLTSHYSQLHQRADIITATKKTLLQYTTSACWHYERKFETHLKACWHYRQFITKNKHFTTVQNVKIWQISPAYVAQPLIIFHKCQNGKNAKCQIWKVSPAYVAQPFSASAS